MRFPPKPPPPPPLPPRPAPVSSHVTFCPDPEDRRVLREAAWHAVQRGDIPDDDRERLHRLYEQLK